MKTADVLSTIAVAVVSFGFVVVKFKMLVKDRHDPRAIGMWLFALTFTLGLFFRSPYVYTWVNTLTGLNNLAWLLSCVCFVLTVYVYVQSCASVAREGNTRQLQWATYGLLLTLLIIAAAFSAWIVNAPTYYYPGDLAATDTGSLLIKTAMLSYALLVVSIPARVYYRGRI